MDPLTNAVLGVLFLAVGAVATVVMYYLRGSSPSKPDEPPRAEPKPTSHARISSGPTVFPSPVEPSGGGPATPAGTVSMQQPAVQRSDEQAGKAPARRTLATETKWYKVSDPDAVPENSVHAVEAGPRKIALTQLDGQYGAVDGRCPHQGGPLSEGALENGVLRCPWHGWGFDPRTGEPSDPHHEGVAAYDVDSRDDGVHVAVEEMIETASSVSDVMVQTMVNWGVQHVFGMVGHSNLGLAEAVRKQEAKGNLIFIGIRHEGAASFACSAYAKLSGKPAACLTIAGPGATNLLTGLWDANVDRAPVLALTGQVNTQVLGPGAFQEIDQASAFEAVAAWSQTVLPTSNHAELITLALKHAIVQRGVAHLIFPDEVQALRAPTDAASGPEGRLGEVAIAPPPPAVARAVELIARANRPTIIVGHGARESMGAVVALAEKLGAPVLTTFKGKGQIPDDHPLAAGVLGRSGTAIASGLMSRADLLIVFGASFANHTGIDRNKPIIQVDFDRLALGKFHPVTVPVWGEIGVAAEILCREMAEHTPSVDIRDELGKISMEQQAGQWPVWQTALKNPNFAEYAELCGGYGERVTEADRLDQVMADAISHEGPALVEIMSDVELT